MFFWFNSDYFVVLFAFVVLGIVSALLC